MIGRDQPEAMQPVSVCHRFATTECFLKLD